MKCALSNFIIVRGDLSGREARRGTYASRPVRRDEPHPDFQSAGHGFCRAIFAPIAFARARGRLGDGLATRGCGALNGGQPAPISFLGSARVQLRQKSHSRSAQTLHFLTSIGRSFHETKDRREDLSWMTRNVTGIAKCL